MLNSTLRTFLAAVALLCSVGAAASSVGGLGGPLFGLETMPNGKLLAADASTGILTIYDGQVESTIALPGVTDAAPSGTRPHIGWASTGPLGDPTTDAGQGLYRLVRGVPQMVVNLYEYEATYNPDGADPPDSNPFDVLALNHRKALVVDAGGNSLLRIDKRGNVQTLAVFPSELVSTANLKALAGCPSDSSFCALPDEIMAESVPTSVAMGADGYYYVGELKGFPGPTGESSIWKVSPRARDAQCGMSHHCMKVMDGGFTSIIDLRFGPDGRLYVVEFDEASWAAVEIFGTPAGGVIKSCNVDTGMCRAVERGIPMTTAVTFGTDGSLWATRNALVPAGAEVVQLRRR